MLTGQGSGVEWRGLSSYLVGAVPLEEAIHPIDIPNVSVIPSGPLPPSPWALLESPRGRSLVEDLRPYADIVLVDAPPLGVGADASVIADWVDGVVIVVDLAKATDRSLKESLRQLSGAKSRLLGLVLNRDRTARVSSYDYYMSAGVEGEKTAPRRGGSDGRSRDRESISG
jgi:capsular exopolysaccharide synthesis family protein